MRQLSAQACLDRARALSLIGVAIPDNRHRLKRGCGERTHPVLAGVRNHISVIGVLLILYCAFRWPGSAGFSWSVERLR